MNVRFVAVAVLALVVIGAAWKLSVDNAPQTEVSRAPLFPDLTARINDVQRLSLRSRDRETHLVRSNDGWVVRNLDGFPARVADVKRTLLQLAALVRVEAKTARPESYARIGVADIGQDGADGTLIELAGDDEAPIADLIAGNTRSSGTQTQRYVRRPNEAQSWLVEGELDAPADPIPWVDAEIADIDADRVRRVEIRPSDGDPVVVSKDKASDNYFELGNVPEGFEPGSRTTVSSLGAILISLRFNSVAAAARVADLEPRSRVRVETFDGIRADIDLFDVDDRTLARFTFAYDPALVASADSAADTATAGNEPDQGVEEPAAASPEEEAATLASRTANWVYELPDYKQRMIDKRLQDLIKERKAEDEDSPPGG